MVSGDTYACLSLRATTGLFVDEHQLIVAYQGNDGRSIRVVKDEKTDEVWIADERLDLHDVIVVDGKIYVVATEMNEVVCLNESFQRVSSWRMPGEKDSAHINSVVAYNGQMLASVFGRFTQHREYKLGTLGRGEVIDIETGHTFIGGLSQPHSLTVVGDLLYLCSSEERQLRVYRNAELIKQMVLPGYARGLAISENHLYVGLSLSRNAQCAENGINSAAIAVMDSATMELKRMIPLPSREIYDLRVVKDVRGLFPYLLVDLLADQAKLMETLGLYKQGYDSLEHERNKILSSFAWQCARPIFHLEQILRRAR